MNILTDDEIRAAWDNHTVPVFEKTGINPIVFARAIEAAIMERFEVVAWMYPEKGIAYKKHSAGTIPLYALKEKR
jgi:hypothetical protein